MDFNQIKDELARNRSIGDEKDNSRLFVELANVYSIEGQKFLNLLSIYVPESDRRHGVATKIIEICEQIARDDKYCGLVIGPFVEDDADYIIRVCKRMKYRQCMPWCMIKQFDETVALVASILNEDMYVALHRTK